MIQYPPHIVEEAGQRTDRALREIIDKLNENDPQIADLDERLAGLQIPSIADIQQALQLGGTNTINITGVLGVAGQVQPSATVGTHAQRLTTPAVLGTFWIETDRTVLYAGEPSGSATVWVYVSGTYFATFSNRPTDLGTTDAGFFFWATDRLQLFEWNGTVWSLLLMLPMSDVHSGRYAVGTVNTTGTAVAWVSGATFNTNWAGRPIIITGVRYTVSSVTNSTNLVLTATAGVQLAVAYYAGFFSIDLTAGVQFFETDRQFLYQTANSAGTVTPNGTTIDWTSGDLFDQTWVGATITINGVDYTVATFASPVRITVTLTAGTPGAVAFSVKSGKWLLVSTHILGDLHNGRYATGTVDTNGTAVTWISGAVFNTNWAGRRIIINNVRYTVSSVTSTTALVLTSTAGVQAGVTYYGGYFSVDLIPGAQFFETDRQFSYQTASISGTVTPNGTTIDWTSGDVFSPTWVGSKITINAVEYVVATVVSTIQLTVTFTAGTPGAVAYSVVSGKWLWVSGQGASTQANLPTDLLTTDAGALWDVTDYYHILKWSGSAFAFQDGDGSGHIVMGNPTAGAPNGGLWGACDGTAYAVLNGNGTTTSITTPNLTGEVFIKGAASFAAQQAAVRATWEAAAVTNNASAGTPAGTVSAPTFTGDAVAAASTAATPDLVAPDVTGTGVSPVTTATGTVSAPTFTGSAMGNHQHDLDDASAQLKVFSEANGGLPLRISCVFYLRR